MSFDVKVQQDKITVEELYALTNKVWSTIKKLKREGKSADDIRDFVYKNYNDYCNVCTAPVSFMLEGMYNKKVFREWVDIVSKGSWQSREDQLKLQAKYAAMLHCYLKGIPAYRREEIEKTYIDTALSEDEKVKKISQKVTEKFEKYEADFRERAIDLIKKELENRSIEEASKNSTAESNPEPSCELVPPESVSAVESNGDQL